MSKKDNIPEFSFNKLLSSMQQGADHAAGKSTPLTHQLKRSAAKFSIASLLLFFVTACSTTTQDPQKSPPSMEWKKGDFQVRFQAGAKGEMGRSYSFYKITYAPAGRLEMMIVKESAHTTDGFECVTNGHPKDWIRIIQDPNGKAILIEEEIPYECGPCSNYLWIHGTDDGVMLEGDYLLLPSQVDDSQGGINYSYPKVISLDGEFLSFEDSSGARVTNRIDQIEKSKRPSTP